MHNLRRSMILPNNEHVERRVAFAQVNIPYPHKANWLLVTLVNPPQGELREASGDYQLDILPITVKQQSGIGPEWRRHVSYPAVDDQVVIRLHASTPYYPPLK